MDTRFAEFEHPAWITAVGTAVGWGLILAVVTLLFFLIPFALWP